MTPDVQLLVGNTELEAALADVLKVVPPDMAVRWTIQIDGLRIVGGWDTQYGKGPSLAAALLDLKRRLEIDAP